MTAENSMSTKNTYRAQFSLLLCAMGWGISGQLNQLALSELTATQIIFWRFAVATLCALIFTLLRRVLLKIQRQTIANTSNQHKSTVTPIIPWIELKNSILLSLPLVAVYYAATYAVLFSTPTTVAFIAGASVIFVPLMDSLLKGRLPSATALIEAALAFTGLGIIALQGSLHLDLNLGIFLSLVNAIGYAAYIVLTGRRLLHTQPAALARINGLQYLWVSLLSGLIGLFEPSASTSLMPYWPTVLAVLGLGILSTYVPFTLQLKAQQLVAPQRVSQLLATIPLFTAALACILGQIPTVHTWIGGCLILISILGPTLFRHRGNGSSSVAFGIKAVGD